MNLKKSNKKIEKDLEDIENLSAANILKTIDELEKLELSGAHIKNVVDKIKNCSIYGDDDEPDEVHFQIYDSRFTKRKTIKIHKNFTVRMFSNT